MFHLFTDVRTGDVQEKQGWEEAAPELHARVILEGEVARMGTEKSGSTPLADDAYLFPQLQIFICVKCLGWHWCT